MHTLHASLEELEHDVWGPPLYASHVVTECHRLRTVPIGTLTVEDMRLLIGQGIGLPHLLPLVLPMLADNPFLEGDLYRGDVLEAVLRTPWAFWERSPALFAQLQTIMDALAQQVQTANDILLPHYQAYFPPPRPIPNIRALERNKRGRVECSACAMYWVAKLIWSAFWCSLVMNSRAVALWS